MSTTREALEHWVACWEAAEAEGLHELLEEARSYSKNTVAGRLCDLVERRIAHGVETAREALEKKDQLVVGGVRLRLPEGYYVSHQNLYQNGTVCITIKRGHTGGPVHNFMRERK